MYCKKAIAIKTKEHFINDEKTYESILYTTNIQKGINNRKSVIGLSSEGLNIALKIATVNNT